MPISRDTLAQAEQILTRRDRGNHAANMGYDSSTHLPEIGLGVHSSLIDLVETAHEAVAVLQRILQQEGTTLISSSHHPLDSIHESYLSGVLPKPMYELLRGKLENTSNLHEGVLETVYPDNPTKGRGWNHEVGTMAASIQPWNSLSTESAASQIGVLQATGWMFNLLTANSPYVEGGLSGKRDYRLEMWGPNGFLSTSRYQSDRDLTENLPEVPKGLTDYFAYVYSHQRPLAVPYQEGEGTAYKTRFMAIVQPLDNQSYTLLDYLRAESVKAVDIETGEIINIKPNVSHLVNGFDFLYFPRYGARLRISMPHADAIDPIAFADAIDQRDEKSLLRLLRQGGIENGGFICAEGRIPATILPTVDRPNWKQFNIPFVLQTALVRGHKEIMRVLQNSGLSWVDLTRTLPEATNDIAQGFSATVSGVFATQLAEKIWRIAKKHLKREELALVGNEIDRILETRQASAEEQIHYVETTLLENPSMIAALLGLLDHQRMVTPTERRNV